MTEVKLDDLIVYSKHNCPACDRLKNQLYQKGIPFVEVNVIEDPEARSFLLEQGHKSVPQMYRAGVHIPRFDKL